MQAVKFQEVFKTTNLTLKQKEALEWLNANAGYLRVGFTKIWRNNWLISLVTPNLVDFTKVGANFKGLDHQVKAIKYLDDNCPEELRLEFASKWNAKSETVGRKTPSKLQAEDYRMAASKLGVSEAHIRAIVEVECQSSGFDALGRPVILFEAHYFSYHTKRQFDKTHPHISSRSWNPDLYTNNEWERLQQALALDVAAAYMSCSWGLGQVMGENYELAGFDNLQEFVNAMHESEARQLEAMLNYIKNTGLVKNLRSNDWVGFAKGYNGPGYAQNNYDIKLRTAYEKYKARGY